MFSVPILSGARACGSGEVRSGGPLTPVFTKSARYYDDLYAWKDYAGEVSRLMTFIEDRLGRAPASLLDVCCGTGVHAELLSRRTRVVGVDLDPALLDIARGRAPDVEFHRADMLQLDLGEAFDVVTCLFSAVAYAETVAGLRQAVTVMATHVAPGGLLIVEPFFSPDEWREGEPHVLVVDKPGLKVVRMNVAERDGDVAVLPMHYLIGTPGEVVHVTETHRLGLFTDQEYRDAFTAADLSVEHDADGMMGRGLYIGRQGLPERDLRA